MIGKRWKFDPLAWWRLRRHIAQLQPDLVHTWMFAANAYGRTAARSAGVQHIVASERCVDPLEERGTNWRSTAGWPDITDAIVVNSRGVRGLLSCSRDLPAEKLRLIYNGIGPAAPQRRSRATQLLAELDLPADARLIGAVGRLWPQKRVKDLIWAADLLKVIRDDVHLLIIGDGPQREDLERFATHCQIDDKVHFLGPAARRAAADAALRPALAGQRLRGAAERRHGGHGRRRAGRGHATFRAIASW